MRKTDNCDQCDKTYLTFRCSLQCLPIFLYGNIDCYFLSQTIVVQLSKSDKIKCDGVAIIQLQQLYGVTLYIC